MEKHDEIAQSGALEFAQRVKTTLITSEARLKLNNAAVRGAGAAGAHEVNIEVASANPSEHLKVVQHEVNAWITVFVSDA